MAQSTKISGHVHRRSEIVAFVKSRGGARIDELADRFGVSTMTIHRDLDQLDAQGMLRKVRSGAEAPLARRSSAASRCAGDSTSPKRT